MSTQSMTRQVDDLDPSEESNAPATRPQFTRRISTRLSIESPENSSGGGNLRPQLSRRDSTNVSSEPFHRGRVVTFRDSFDEDDPDDDDNKKPETGRALSAREAVAAQEAAEAAAATEAETSEGAPMMMSLMDLLEETDREMGLEGSRYILSDEKDFNDDEECEDDEDGEGAMEETCCICMVKHKGAAFAPCGHSFCRMCSRELMVAKGNCPLCNNFIVEILEIF